MLNKKKLVIGSFILGIMGFSPMIMSIIEKKKSKK